ncbi:hypothetical protein HELRODRAFT_161738 [Helobdella robusta]|uniref:EGF-like domain-containing protein n=1 Tax=Helobdella robusta TaxID=6412 RepID=T1ERU9_HELRO|nr:hypothetical protein HELRODRAFT_161738 [Helobdella robusta]ESO02466.1 hypothetical protein HELRODRAFT_161738 [Helobdella robusta]
MLYIVCAFVILSINLSSSVAHAAIDLKESYIGCYRNISLTKTVASVGSVGECSLECTDESNNMIALKSRKECNCIGRSEVCGCYHLGHETKAAIFATRFQYDFQRGVSTYSHCRNKNNGSYEITANCPDGCDPGWRGDSCRERDCSSGGGDCPVEMECIESTVNGNKYVECVCPPGKVRNKWYQCEVFRLNETFDVSIREDIRDKVNLCGFGPEKGIQGGNPMIVVCENFTILTRFVFIQPSDERMKDHHTALAELEVFEAGCDLFNGRCGEVESCREEKKEGTVTISCSYKITAANANEESNSTTEESNATTEESNSTTEGVYTRLPSSNVFSIVGTTGALFAVLATSVLLALILKKRKKKEEEKKKESKDAQSEASPEEDEL